jgi:hypothetical protein
VIQNQKDQITYNIKPMMKAALVIKKVGV